MNLISKKDFAERAGATPGAISHIFKKDHPACVNNKINLNHPEAKIYLEQKAFRLERKKQRQIQNETPFSDSRPANLNTDFVAPDIPEEENKPVVPEVLANLTLEEIVMKYGGLPGFKMYVSTLKEFNSYQAKKLKYDEDRGELINKNYEAKILFEALELLFERLVNDIPHELTQRIISIVKRGDDDMALLVQNEYTAANSRALKICKSDLLERLEMNESEIDDDKE